MNILIVDNHDSFTYNLVQLVETAGCRNVTVVQNDRPDCDAGPFDKIIFSPGPGVPAEESGAMKNILAKYAGKRSILGICLGHQAIAEFFGATLVQLRKARHGIEAEIAISEPDDALFAGLPPKIHGGLYHSWAVSGVHFPDCLQTTAISDDGVIMAISHRIYDIKGLQFHPELIMTEHGAAIIRNWLGERSVSPVQPCAD